MNPVNTLLHYLCDYKYLVNINELPLNEEYNKTAVTVADFLEKIFYSSKRITIYKTYNVYCITVFVSRFISVLNTSPRPGLANLIWMHHYDLIDMLFHPFPLSILKALISCYYNNQKNFYGWITHKSAPYITNSIIWSVVTLHLPYESDVYVPIPRWLMKMDRLNRASHYMPIISEEHLEHEIHNQISEGATFYFPDEQFEDEKNKEIMMLLGIGKAEVVKFPDFLKKPLSPMRNLKLDEFEFESVKFESKLDVVVKDRAVNRYKKSKKIHIGPKLRTSFMKRN